MSKPNSYRRNQPQRYENEVDTMTETVSTSTEDEQKSEDTVEAVVDSSTNTVENTVSQPENNLVDERQSLINELGVKPTGVDIVTGQPILPNTPMLRRMKELAEAQVTSVVKTNKTLTDVVKEKYNPQVANHPTVVYVVSVLSEYVERMSPSNTLTEEEGANYQLKLARLYDAALSAEPELAMVCLEIIVATVTEHLSAAFSERYALRFINIARLNPEQAYRFHMLTTLFMELGRRAGQKNPAPIGESVNIQKLMDFIPDRNAKANLAEFLS